MLEINIHKKIGAKTEDDKFFEMIGFECEVFSYDDLRMLVDNTTETELKLNIRSSGGGVREAINMYDYLRQSGKTIYANIDGECHSSAIILLLSAPKENRTADANSRMLIHQVRGVIDGGFTTDELLLISNEIQTEETALLNIYADRTGTDIAILEALMKEEKERTASEMIQYGFISKTNIYNTNKKENKMSETKKSLLTRLENFLAKNEAKAVEEVTTENYDHTAEDGTIIFTSESENIAVGMPASPAGEFTTGDGKVVTVVEVEGVTVIVLIALSAEYMPAPDTTTIDDLTNELCTAKTNLVEAVNLVNELKNQVKSNFEPTSRLSTVNSSSNVVKTVADYKNEAKERKNLKRK